MLYSFSFWTLEFEFTTFTRNVASQSRSDRASQLHCQGIPKARILSLCLPPWKGVLIHSSALSNFQQRCADTQQCTV